jgi:serine/threonine protein phosphatase 1
VRVLTQDNVHVHESVLLPHLATLDDDQRIYAIGDIHGRADLLIRMLDAIDSIERAHPKARTTLVVLGDMIDRGPGSREVISLLVDRSAVQDVRCLMGNHERLMLDVLFGNANLNEWLRLGGLATLKSYGVASPDVVEEFKSLLPVSHVRFFQSLLLAWRTGTFLFVHAGLRSDVPFNEQKDVDLMQIREPFLSHRRSFGDYVIHGHTPVRSVDIRENRMNLDTAAYQSGVLSAAVLEKASLHRLTIRGSTTTPRSG